MVFTGLFVTDTQRQRVLIYVFQYLQLYSDVVLLDATASHSLDISPTIQSQIFQLYEQFKTLIPSSDDIPPSIPKSPSSATSENFDLTRVLLTIHLKEDLLWTINNTRTC